MFSLKNLTFRVLILAIFTTLTNCAPTDSLSNEVTRRAGVATSGKMSILNQAQFEASGLTLITPNPPYSDNGNGKVVCETSAGSPWIRNTRLLGSKIALDYNGLYCCNWHINAGGCSHIMTIEDASTAMCGAQGCIKCKDLTMNIYRIGNWCRKDDKAGGVSQLNQGCHVILY